MTRAAEMKTLRAIKGVTLRERIRSKVIREDFEIQDIVRFTRDNVDKMTKGRWANWVKDKKSNSGRPSGRPPKVHLDICFSRS
ncbi:hypothetical protein Trydic_g2234 [Trypoxylus dichotomus]